MFLRRSALALARATPSRAPIAARAFSASVVRREAKADPKIGESSAKMVPFDQIKTEEDLIPSGGAVGTIPTDLDQATGLERLEILGKMQGVDVFDMKPLDASRKGTLDNPVTIRSFGDEQYVGCTGVPADSHVTHWLVTSRKRPLERCPECGNCIKMEYVGPTEDAHGHDHHGPDPERNWGGEPESMVDFLKPEYRSGL